MSMWQFMAAVEGYAKAHAPDDGKISSSDADEVWQWMQAKDGASPQSPRQ